MNQPAKATAATATAARQTPAPRDIVPTIGVEEEYLLLDPHSAKPLTVADTVAAHLEGSAHVARDDIQRELLSCQLETATSVCSTLTEAEESLLNFRRSLDAGGFADMIVDQCDEMLRQCDGQPLVMGLALHTFVMGQPYRLKHLRRALRHVLQAGGERLWPTTAGAIVDHVLTLPEGTIT